MESDARVSKVSPAEWSWISADFRATAAEHEIMNQPERSQSQKSRIRSTGQEAVIIWDARWGVCWQQALDSRGLYGLCLLCSAEIPVLGVAIGDLVLVKDNRAAALKRERMPERPSQHQGGLDGARREGPGGLSGSERRA